jgi:hypothetical protein
MYILFPFKDLFNYELIEGDGFRNLLVITGASTTSETCFPAPASRNRWVSEPFKRI